MPEKCCARRRDNSGVDDVEVERAINGIRVTSMQVAGRTVTHRTTLNARELDTVVWRLASQRQWGCKRIASHLGYGKTHINMIMNRLGIADPDRRP